MFYMKSIDVKLFIYLINWLLFYYNYLFINDGVI